MLAARLLWCAREGAKQSLPCLAAFAPCTAAQVLTAARRPTHSAAAALVPPPPHSAAHLQPWPASQHPIERATTPPVSWYYDPSVLRLEEEAVFRNSWLAVTHASRLAAPRTYAAGSLLRLQWLACRDEQGRLRAFHNVSGCP